MKIHKNAPKCNIPFVFYNVISFAKITHKEVDMTAISLPVINATYVVEMGDSSYFGNIRLLWKYGAKTSKSVKFLGIYSQHIATNNSIIHMILSQVIISCFTINIGSLFNMTMDIIRNKHQ